VSGVDAERAPARTEEAHLLRLDGDRVARVESFDAMDGREAWYTPWGDPADVRSISVARDGALHVNVHVGASRARATAVGPGRRPSTSRSTYTRSSRTPAATRSFWSPRPTASA